MVQSTQASNLDLYQVHEQFDLKLNRDEQFFLEWQSNLPEINDYETHPLDQMKTGYRSLAARPLLEEVTKLLSLAGLASFPCEIKAEQPVEITIEDEDELFQGKINLLLLHQRFLAIVVEAEHYRLNVREALPQALFHMMSSSNDEQPTYGLAVSGSEFLFIKLVKQEPPQYGLSRLFSLINPGNDLYTVLAVLKHLREIVLR